MTAAVVGHFGGPFAAALGAATVAGALAGIIAGLPALRARGVYLLLSTFTLHHVVLYALPELHLRLLGGAALSYPSAAFGPLAIDTPLRWYLLLLAIVAAAYWGLRNILASREGLAMMAMRDHELGAAALGADPRLLTLKAFAISSAMAGLAGALYVYLAPGATPESFGLDFAIAFLAMIVVGGLGSPLGALIGATLWRLAPPLVDAVSARVGETTPLGGWIAGHPSQLIAAAFGLATILVLLFAPSGMAGLTRALFGGRGR
jgi:branched-chain amino acid transport system permease protein